MPSREEWKARLETRVPKSNETTREFALSITELYDYANPDSTETTRAVDLKSLLKNHLPQHLQTLPTIICRDKNWVETIQIVAEAIPIINEQDSGELILNVNNNRIKQNSNRGRNQSERRNDQNENNQNNQRYKSANNDRRQHNSNAPRDEQQQNGHDFRPQSNNNVQRLSKRDQICYRCRLKGHHSYECYTELPAPHQYHHQNRKSSCAQGQTSASANAVQTATDRHFDQQ